MKTQTQIRVKANQSKRTFTLRLPYVKYRTMQFSVSEFRSAKYWTQNDWKQFLKTDEYYKVK